VASVWHPHRNIAKASVNLVQQFVGNSPVLLQNKEDLLRFPDFDAAVIGREVPLEWAVRFAQSERKHIMIDEDVELTEATSTKLRDIKSKRLLVDHLVLTSAQDHISDALASVNQGSIGRISQVEVRLPFPSNKERHRERLVLEHSAVGFDSPTVQAFHMAYQILDFAPLNTISSLAKRSGNHREADQILFRLANGRSIFLARLGKRASTRQTIRPNVCAQLLVHGSKGNMRIELNKFSESEKRRLRSNHFNNFAQCIRDCDAFSLYSPLDNSLKTVDMVMKLRATRS
jgi:hypothetical protein